MNRKKIITKMKMGIINNGFQGTFKPRVDRNIGINGFMLKI